MKVPPQMAVGAAAPIRVSLHMVRRRYTTDPSPAHATPAKISFTWPACAPRFLLRIVVQRPIEGASRWRVGFEIKSANRDESSPLQRPYVRRAAVARRAKLDPKFEKALADEGLSRDLEAWPEY